MLDNKSTEYINSVDYKVLEPRLRDLAETMDDLVIQQRVSRKLRYAEVDVEFERDAGNLQPDELWVSRHLIDNNIRREQSAYVQYITQSPRAVILEDSLTPSIDLATLERDLTKKIRYDGWQLSMFANIDCFQANGYSIVELVRDESTIGEISYESVEFADFGFVADCRDIQQLEMTARAYYFTKTRLQALIGDPENPKPDSDWNSVQVQKLLDSPPDDNVSVSDRDLKDKSLHQVYKMMFRVDGIVHVGWCVPVKCDDWLRAPRPLFIGRRKLTQPQAPNQLGTDVLVNQQPSQQDTQMFQSYQAFMQKSMGKGKLLDWAVSIVAQGMTPPSEPENETLYPYYLFPYLISENNTISNLKGRVYLDQDMQEAVSSLTSSTITQARRSAGLYGSKDANDPNDDVLMQKNITLKSGCIVNSKVTFTQLASPEPGMFSAIQMLEAGNQNETSNVNFAVQNRQDSRKTAKEMSLAEKQSQQLSTVQVVLFSIALKKLYSVSAAVIQSRVLAGLIEVDPSVLPLYARRFIVKPSGDTDVIEKQQMIQTMIQSWGVIQSTGAATAFLNDLLEKMFPDSAAKYIQAMQAASQQQNSQQMQQMQSMMQTVKAMAGGIVKLSQHPDFFSDSGKLHAFPIVEHFADVIKQTESQLKGKSQ